MTIKKRLLPLCLLITAAIAVFFLFDWDPEPLAPARGQIVLLNANINLYKTVDVYQEWVDDAGMLSDSSVYDVTLKYLENPNIVEGFKYSATAEIDSVLLNRRGKPYLIKIRLLDVIDIPKVWFVVPENISKTIKPGAEQ